MSLADAIRVLNQKVPPVPSPGNPREPLQASNGAGFPEVPPVPSDKSKVQTAGKELIDGGQAGNDLEPANDRVVVHVPELTLSTGKKISCDLSVPRENLERLRAVVRFRLKGGGGGGSVLGSPGTPREELVADLQARYGSRLETIDGDSP